MTKTASTYVGFLLVFGVGLWAILSLGAIYAKAPTDIAGEWKTVDGETIHIEQSGTFLEMSLNDGHVYSLVSTSETQDKVGRPRIEFAGADQKVSIQGRGDEFFTFTLVGKSNMKFDARRTAHGFVQSAGH